MDRLPATILRPDPPAAPPRQRGMSLIEVLVAVLVLSLGMLGIAAMQSTALRNSQSAFENSQAVLHVYGIIDAMRANRAEAIIGSYNLTNFTCNPPAGGSLAEDDLELWIRSLKDNLGDSACGRIQCGGDSCVVEVRWNDQRGLLGDEDRTVRTETLL